MSADSEYDIVNNNDRFLLFSTTKTKNYIIFVETWFQLLLIGTLSVWKETNA